jgi:2-isopropylmalate synthase
VKRNDLFEVLSYNVFSGRNGAVGSHKSDATIKIKIAGKVEHVAAEGNGPLNALDIALRKALLPYFPVVEDIHFSDYWVRMIHTKGENIEGGTDAKVEVLVTLCNGKGGDWAVKAVSTDIVEASWLALEECFSKAIASLQAAKA